MLHTASARGAEVQGDNRKFYRCANFDDISYGEGGYRRTRWPRYCTIRKFNRHLHWTAGFHSVSIFGIAGRRQIYGLRRHQAYMDKFIAGFILAGGLALCISGFTAKGLPLSQHKRITGRPARIIGIIALIVSLAAAIVWVALASTIH